MTDTTDDYGYLLVHFIEDPDGYAEKIYMDISDGDNPHRWVPLNDGKPVLASHLGTTGVRDPHIIRNPDTGTWYIIATDLRVFGGDGGGWYEWSHHASTNLIIWESDDLLHWSEPRMLDVSRKPGGSQLERGMAWACEFCSMSLTLNVAENFSRSDSMSRRTSALSFGGREKKFASRAICKIRAKRIEAA